MQSPRSYIRALTPEGEHQSRSTPAQTVAGCEAEKDKDFGPRPLIVKSR